MTLVQSNEFDPKSEFTLAWQTHWRVISVLYVLLAAIAVIAIDLRIVLIPTAVVVLSLSVGGMLVFRHFKRAISIPWPARHDEGRRVVVIDGTPLAAQGYDQELVVTLRTDRSVELAACTLLAGGKLWVSFFFVGRGATAGLEIGGFEAEIICLVGLMVLLTTLRWFTERRFLRFSHYTIGLILGYDPGFFRKSISYQFFDGDRQRRRGQYAVATRIERQRGARAI